MRQWTSMAIVAVAAVIVMAWATQATVEGDAATDGPGMGRAKDAGFAIVSAHRLDLGQNVLIEGAIGVRYGTTVGELDDSEGSPLTMSSDFSGRDDDLDVVLDLLQHAIVAHDVNGDHRLDVDDPIEQLGLADMPDLVDVDGDRHIDDLDVFLAHYDTNDDGRVVYSATLSGGMRMEFPAGDPLARLIDEARPDRNRDGRVTAADTARGYRDGLVDGRDLYAKVRGRLVFAVAQAAWEEAAGASYQTIVQGPIRTGHVDVDPVRFEAAAPSLPEITKEDVDPDDTWFKGAVQGGRPFGVYDARTDRWSGQVGAGLRHGGAYVPMADGTWESIPFGSPEAYDHFQRQVFRGMTFTNVRIPIGTNALFDECVFVGVTWIETNADCGHPNWNYAGAVEPVDDGTGDFVYELRFPDLVTETSDGTVVADTRFESNNLRFHGCTFVGTITGDVPDEFTHWRNAIQFTGRTRFLLGLDEVSSAAFEEEDTDSAVALVGELDPVARAELATSSLLMPGWFVRFDNTDDDGTTRLRGLIVAGVLDVHGWVDVHGTLVLTFRPVEGEGPLFYGGHPAAFATTIGANAATTAITVRANPTARRPAGLRIPISQ